MSLHPEMSTQLEPAHQILTEQARQDCLLGFATQFIATKTKTRKDGWERLEVLVIKNLGKPQIRCGIKSGSPKIATEVWLLACVIPSTNAQQTEMSARVMLSPTCEDLTARVYIAATNSFNMVKPVLNP